MRAGRLVDGVVRLARSRPVRSGVEWLRPDPASPSAPMATVAWLDSFSPSLMPRTSALQGVVGGLAVLSARAIADRSEAALEPLLGPHLATRRRLLVRGGLAVLGLGLSNLPERGHERLWWSSLRGGGAMLRSIATGGAIHDIGHAAWARQPERSGVRAAVATASVVAGVGLWADRRLHQRIAAIEPWPIEQRTAVPQSAAISAAVVLGGRLLGEAVHATGRSLGAWLGPGRAKAALAFVANGMLWTRAVNALYHAAVERVGQGNAAIEAGYDRAPSRPTVSGGPGSQSHFAELGRQGRRFVTDVLDRDLIERVMGEPAAADPVRVYVGHDAEPLYPTARAELALEELERTGAYDRRFLLLTSPTGTGWVDQTLVESAELFARGDIATCAIQYGRYPSYLALQNIPLGRSQFRILLLGVRERLRAVPPERRPTVLVFGESLGAWTASDVIMHLGIGGFDHYGIDRALWVGLPWMARWSRSGMIRGSSDLVPPGTVGVFDRWAQLEARSPAERERLRAVILSHDNDPIAVLGPDLAVQQPRWLQGDHRGRGVPDGMRWSPVVTFLQTAVDAVNSMVQVPGAFTSYGHDYRADMARFVHAAYRMPDVDEATMRRVEEALVDLDLARAKRLGTLHA